jgi:hypothetical protein
MSDTDKANMQLRIQLQKFVYKCNLPMTKENEGDYHLIRNGITGGLANVLNRKNNAGVTHTNKFFFENN